MRAGARVRGGVVADGVPALEDQHEVEERQYAHAANEDGGLLRVRVRVRARVRATGRG